MIRLSNINIIITIITILIIINKNINKGIKQIIAILANEGTRANES